MLGFGTFQVGANLSRRLFRWTEETGIWMEEPGMTGLLTPPPGYPVVGNTGFTPDLSVASGYAGPYGSSMQVPARWTQETGWVALRDLEGGDTLRNGPVYAMDVSADGTIIVGRGVDPSGPEPFIWDADHGTRNLTTVLRDEYGLGALLAGWNLTEARHISDDGRTIMGYGNNPAGQKEFWVAYLGSASTNTWNVDASGEWSVTGNWTLGLPIADGATAVFGGAITAARTVTLDLPVTVGSIDFKNSASYTVAGVNTLTLDAASNNATINVATGNHVISAPVTLADNTVITVTPLLRSLSITGSLTANGVTLTKAGAGTLRINNLRAAGLSVNGGTVAIAPNSGAPGLSTSVLRTLSIAGDATPTAKFDLNNNAAIIDYTGTSPVATIRQQILSGRGGPGLGKTWNGQGITSGAAATANAAVPESRSIGFAENAALPLGSYTTFRGQPLDETSILIAYTRTGDANLDGLVNDDDVTIVGATYAPGVPQPSWAMGDFDYNGFVDDDDVTLLGAFYDPSAAALTTSPADAASNVAAVPEPATSALMAIAMIVLAGVLRASNCSPTAHALNRSRRRSNWPLPRRRSRRQLPRQVLPALWRQRR
jgi:hypothetical protein